jgi:hypothetical protein
VILAEIDVDDAWLASAGARRIPAAAPASR